MSIRTHVLIPIALALALIAGFTPAMLPETAYGTTTNSTQSSYDHSATAEQNGVTFTVEWNDTTSKTTTFHVTATGGSGEYKARMDVPTYWDNNTQESVCDPTRGSWTKYATFTDGANGTDFTFDFTASGTYKIYFYFMSISDGVPYLRTSATVTINDPARPSVTQIVNNAVAQARAKTDGSDYEMALWLHDWAINQLDYDRSLNYCSAESGLTRGLGTCESYQRIYAKLLNAAGMANGRIEGNGHTWNAVKLDGEWYQMDLTWDDGDNSKYYGFDARHLYFGLTDELMAVAHPDHGQTYKADGYTTKSTSLKNNYFVRHGEAAEWANDYVSQIQTKLDAKEETFSVNAKSSNPQTGSTLPPSIANIQNGVITYALNNMTWKSNSQDATLAVTYDDTANSGKGAFKFKATYKKEEAGTPGSTGKDDAGTTTPGATDPAKPGSGTTDSGATDPTNPGTGSSEPSKPGSSTDAPGTTTPGESTTKPATDPSVKQLKLQNISVKTHTKTVKKSKLKKKAQAVSGAIKVSGAKGKLSYSKVSGSSKLSINKQNGKVTVKKNTKKGTYKIKVKASASSTKDYKAAAKTATITIKVR